MTVPGEHLREPWLISVDPILVCWEITQTPSAVMSRATKTDGVLAGAANATGFALSRALAPA